MGATAEECKSDQGHCQTFPQGCCGCCVNTRWEDERILSFLAANTAAAERNLPAGRPGLLDLVRLHWARGGWLDHLLAFWLVMPTFGLSAWAWFRFLGSCRFAGFLDREGGRVGCLIHPLRVGEPDCRKHAFPLIPTLGCNRALRCAMLDDGRTNWSWGCIEASRKGRESLSGK